MKKTTHYVDNKQLYAAMVDYHEQVKLHRAGEAQKPIVPNYIGECLLLIANRLSHKPNFINYSYREEMISDGIENCIAYIDNFDPSKSTNPFAYFTQIIYFAFLRRIQKEKKQQYIKHKAFEHSVIFDMLAEYGDDSDGNQLGHFNMANDNVSSFIESFEDNLEKKKVKAKLKGVEKFLADEVEDLASEIIENDEDVNG